MENARFESTPRETASSWRKKNGNRNPQSKRNALRCLYKPLSSNLYTIFTPILQTYRADPGRKSITET